MTGRRDLRLDGIRGIAVLLVLLYHTPMSGGRLLPGGWIGVDIFFVLSGYLITSLLLAEHDEHGRIDRRAFYGRRVRRLLPALAVVLAAWLLVTQAGLLPVERAGLASTPAGPGLALVPLLGLAAVYNWVLAFNVPSPHGMVHLWTLSVEEQFYLVWPTVLVLVTARARRPLHLLWLLVTVGAFVATALDILAVGGHNRNFAYFSSLTSSVGLFVGAALAIARPRHRSVLLGATALAAIAVAALFVPDSKPGLLPWFVLVGCGAGAVLITSSGTRVDRLLTVSWLRYAGRRSYAIYLWSLPLDYALEQWIGISWRMDVLLLILAFVAAELSWRLVERRFTASRVRADPGQDWRANAEVASASAV